jgi:hypothetical protein
LNADLKTGTSLNRLVSAHFLLRLILLCTCYEVDQHPFAAITGSNTQQHLSLLRHKKQGDLTENNKNFIGVCFVLELLSGCGTKADWKYNFVVFLFGGVTTVATDKTRKEMLEQVKKKFSSF